MGTARFQKMKTRNVEVLAGEAVVRGYDIGSVAGLVVIKYNDQLF